jgi:hypothetical protein
VKHNSKLNKFCEFGPVMKKTDECLLTIACDEPYCGMSLGNKVLTGDMT